MYIYIYIERERERERYPVQMPNPDDTSRRVFRGYSPKSYASCANAMIAILMMQIQRAQRHNYRISYTYDVHAMLTHVHTPCHTDIYV